MSDIEKMQKQFLRLGLFCDRYGDNNRLLVRPNLAFSIAAVHIHADGGVFKLTREGHKDRRTKWAGAATIAALEMLMADSK